MDFKQLQTYLLSKPGVIEERPFGPDTLVYKVMGKMYALVGEDTSPLRLNLKCDPDEALALRDMYTAVTPGYHMNKKHWNSVYLDGSLPEAEIRRMVDNSYNLVVQGLKKAEREALQNPSSSL